MAALTAGAFARVLENQRETLNARFAMATIHRTIDRESFALHLREVVAPIIEAVNVVEEVAAERVTLALYDLSLELFSSDLMGTNARIPYVNDAWRRLLPLLPRLLRIDARRVAGAVTNGVVNVAGYAGAGATKWIDDLIRCSAELTDLDVLFEAGRLAAWHRGLAHYRDAALDGADHLGPSIVSKLLAIGVDDASSAIARMRSDRWSDVTATNKSAAVHIDITGAFRGFGGSFLEPPMVAASANRLIVASGDKQWQLHADRFGATLLPLHGRIEVASTLDRAIIGTNGEVELNGQRGSFPQMKQATSAAVVDGVAAITLRHSFGVYVVGVV